jgi:hypothetical protein
MRTRFSAEVSVRRTAKGLALAAMMAISAFGADWMSTKSSDRNETFYVDKASVQRNGNVVTFWEKLVFENPVKVDDVSGKLIKEKRVYRIMNCQNQTQGFRYGATFADDGKLIESISHDDSQVRKNPVAPGSVAAWEMRLMCAAAGLRIQ